MRNYLLKHLSLFVPTRGMGTHQTNRSIRSPLQQPSTAQEATAAPRSDPAPAPHRHPVRERLGPNQDAHSIISNRRQAWHDDDVHRAAMRAGDTGPGRTIEGTCETRPRHCRRPDDRSPSPEGPGPRAFGWRIRRAPFPQRFQHLAKYIGETNPGIWLEDFWLACRAGGVDDDLFIIQYLPICVGEHVRVWLEFLPHDSIRD